MPGRILLRLRSLVAGVHFDLHHVTDVNRGEHMPIRIFDLAECVVSTRRIAFVIQVSRFLFKLRRDLQQQPLRHVIPGCFS